MDRTKGPGGLGGLQMRMMEMPVKCPATVGGRDGPRKWSVSKAWTGQTYHMGVIDIMHDTNWKKRAELYVKALMGKDIDGLSAMAPLEFKNRFINAMEHRFPLLDELKCEPSVADSDAELFRTASGNMNPDLNSTRRQRGTS